jgi:hypothetical protein
VAKVATFKLAFCVFGCSFGSGLKSFYGLRLSGLALVWLAVFVGCLRLLPAGCWRFFDQAWVMLKRQERHNLVLALLYNKVVFHWPIS